MTENEFEKALSRNSQRLFLIALSYTNNPYDAEDVMQNTFIKLWSSNNAFDSEEHMDKWLTRVCINECKDVFRRLFRTRSVPLERAYDYPVNDKHFNIDLFNAVSSLSKRERMAVHFFYYEDLSIGEISEMTGIRESTIKSLLSRARKKLKEKLGDDWTDEQ